MYRRFAESQGFKCTTIEENKEDFGIKSAELQIDGPFAYGYLAGEKGTHRLVRISPFNAQGKRQTSFAAVETYPVLPDTDSDEIVIPEKDIEVSLEGLNIAPSNLVQLDNDITNGEDSDDSDDDDGELVVEDVTNEQES